MKAFSFASIAALAIVGTACSQDAEPDGKTPAPVESTPVSAPADDGFNLAIPGETGTGTVADDGFNLGLPAMGNGTAADGFNLPAALPTTSGLDLPEIEAPLVEDVAPISEDDPDAIIRLEE
ncbi:MAG: hypothetical protein QNI84_12775 [Henriciella sp.]|nr:hypothetical protein [Henriciella sp.]